MGGKIKYPAMVSYPPEMKIMELRVDTSAGVDEITPALGKRFRVFGVLATQFVDSSSAVPTSVRATLAFGDDHTGTPSKILAAWRQSDIYDDAGACMCNINVVGNVNEVVRLTNVTHTGAANVIITRSVVYYIEE